MAAKKKDWVAPDLADEQEPQAGQEPETEPAVVLVTMTKDGGELAVHPSCVAAHERRGWVCA